MRRRSNKSAPAVTLFPFLTVLISTMGALIVMLVLGVNAANQDAKSANQEKSEEIEERLADIEARRDLLQIRFEGWLARRDELLIERHTVRERMFSLEADLEQLRERQMELVNVLDSIDGAEEDSDQVLEEDNLEALRAEVDRLNTEYENKRLLMASQPPQTLYSIVPHHGTSGTTRRPIYIECGNGKIILQPYGIELAEGDFSYDLQLGNPLDAALTEIRRYYQNLPGTDSQNRPYPLIVVRPDGSSPYALARRAMSQWDDEFGYELIDKSLDLDFGEAPPELTEKIAAAVQAAKLEALARNLNRPVIQRDVLPTRGSNSYDSARGGVLEVDSVNGGFKRAGSASTRATGQYVSQREQGSLGNSSSTSISKTSEGDSFSNSSPLQQEYSDQGSIENADSSQFTSERSSHDMGSSSNGSTTPTTGGQSSLAMGSDSDCQCLADQQGANWAVPQSGGNNISLVRPVRISCYGDRMIVWPEHGTTDEARSIRFPSTSSQDAIPELVAQIHKKIEAWGPAVRGGYWKPELKIHVNPGGESRARDLEKLLENSGLEVKVHRQ
ncbi:MAG: hypothetical protein KF851_04955 [Pirellulaceae bacterium]|nr:hypothetical protein [Pirellulaceae bacterium]